MAAVTSPARHAALLATSASNREQRQSKAHRAMEWPKPSSARSSVTMSASVRVRMQRPSCTSYQLGSITTTRFTRTRHSDIVHPVSSSQLTEARAGARSFGGYNTTLYRCRALVGRMGEELRKKKPEHFFDERSLADLHAFLERAAWVLEQTIHTPTSTAKGLQQGSRQRHR